MAASFYPGDGLQTSTLTTADRRTIRYVHAGEGLPVVVFEAGLGAGAGEWVTVQRLVSATSRTVSYDRAGHGGSTADVVPRSLARICEDLDLLVREVSPQAPVVLVGHSWGGPILRCYADQHPQRIAGLVMIDTTTTAVLDERQARSMPLTTAVANALHPLTRRLIRRALLKNVGPEVSPEDREVLNRAMNSKQGIRTAIDEAKAASTSLPLMARWEQQGLPNVPVISIAGAGTGAHPKIRAKLIAGAQAEMARHPQGECRIIDGTNHYVPQDRPLQTAQAILDIVGRVSTTTSA
jgi:pimeloyl-ACP methyl ester carboxylesterase